MKFLTKNNAIAILLMLLTTYVAIAQVPARPDPPQLVNDFAGILAPEQVKWLEDSLVRFDRRTSNQVVIVTMADLGGLEPAEMAYEIGEQWQVGTSEDNNGIVVLVKPKTRNSRGQAFIATGYGLEGALPDATCKMIVDREMIPHFKNNDYFGGIAAAVGVICPIAAGEYSKERYEEENALDGFTVGLFAIFGGLLMFFLIVTLFRHSGNNDNNNAGNGTGTFGPGGIFLGGIPLGGMGRSHHGGSFGGGFGGGFGGFGGGSFGGGGAGGSW